MQFPQLILQTNQDTSDPFGADGCNAIVFQGTVAGEWKLQFRLKEVTGATWEDYIPRLSWGADRKYQVFDASEDLEYRLTGGTQGASAYLIRVRTVVYR